MIDYIQTNEWKIIEEGWDPKRVTQSESLFSIGNGRMGQRANFEEDYSGETFPGNYVAGIYYPDKTRVGWWKNGYPQYFAKVLNAANWMGIQFTINGVDFDLAHCKVTDFRRELNMKEGTYSRSFVATNTNGISVKVDALRFYSIVDDACGVLKYNLTILNSDAQVQVTPYVDFDVKNTDSNYNKKFWKEVGTKTENHRQFVQARVKKSGFEVCSASEWVALVDGKKTKPLTETISQKKYVAHQFLVDVKQNETLSIIKYGTNISSENHPKKELQDWADSHLNTVVQKGFDTLWNEQKAAWAAKWNQSDIIIHGDAKAQQAIRYNIFMLNQTYTGEDDRLNIGPKGFTGEKYGGATYWDTEAYCIPFYLSTADAKVSKQLLMYRYNHLPKAIENAKMLGFTDGAALYPMVTMNGEECHNEWEITFEEIHRNGAIAYGIYRYQNYTGDHEYLAQYGLEVLIGISRFWAQRVHWSERKNQYVMLGVTGPNEYENNINNNWYTSYIAAWCLRFTAHSVEKIRKSNPDQLAKIFDKTHFNEDTELKKWAHINENIYLPTDESKGIVLQQDNYLDKEQILVQDLNPAERPLNQYWSWDRILRSGFIKQADVLQGFYFFEDDFSIDELQKNFDFYEPRTVHESSLSPCVHSILAAKLGKLEQAYQFYLRTARLDLDDYNDEVHEGLHITSMAGTWMSVVEGFGGMRIKNGTLQFTPQLPKQWDGYEFQIRFRDHILHLSVSKNKIELENIEGNAITIQVNNQAYVIEKNRKIEIA
tara:strand:- start:6058 stop:8364 length:2307 start_codon:yes stop_codon:yes gene_type:complete